MFTQITEQWRREVLEDPGILHTVFFNGRPARIRTEEMDVKRLLFNARKLK